ncbi:MAG TPA: hypothetical protein VFE30_07505 [Anaeromyxobacteraceae bacterium]|jgi:hypothetical protein|nr:hypothetical protein [Anaeromyxobacteraceae bacterium]
MSLDTTLGALLEAHLTPVRVELERLSAEVIELRRTLPPMLVPLREAARRLGVSYATARRRASAHEWPTRRDGGRILVDLGALRPLADEDLARMAHRARGSTLGMEGDRHGET